MQGDPRTRRAIAIAAKIRRKYPYGDFGRAYLKRGTAENLARFGSTYKTATAEQRAMRKSMGYTGRGLYVGGRGGYWGKLLGGMVGMSKVGDQLGDLAGAAVRKFAPSGGLIMDAANAAGKAFKAVTGRGTYIVSNDLAPGVNTAPDAPIFSSAGDDPSIVLSNREYVGKIYAPSGANIYQNTTYPINPAMGQTFPWLSQVAANYEEYEMIQCAFMYKPQVAEFAANTGVIGQVITAVQYDPDDEPFTNVQSMMRSFKAVSGKCSEPQYQWVECEPKLNSGTPGKYTRTGPLPTCEDLKEYDHGTLNIALTDIPDNYANQALGELWVSYTVRLRKPKEVTAMGFAIDRELIGKFSVSSPRDSKLAPLGVSPVDPTRCYARKNNIGCKVGSIQTSTIYPSVSFDSFAQPGASSSSITFPAGYTGNVAIKGYVQSLYNVADGSTTFPMYSFFTTNSKCNITPIYDMAQANHSGTVNNVYVNSDPVPGSINSQFDPYAIVNGFGAFVTEQSVNADTTGTAGVIVTTQPFELHLRITNVTNGIDNTLYWTMGSKDHAEKIVACVVDIVEYNTSLNFKQNGSNDAVDFININGVTISPDV